MDSSGLGELIASHTTITTAGGEMKLLHLAKRVHDLLKLTKLYTVFDVHEDEAHAVRSFACIASGISPISSRSNVPRCACSKQPAWRPRAPV